MTAIGYVAAVLLLIILGALLTAMTIVTYLDERRRRDTDRRG